MDTLYLIDRSAQIIQAEVADEYMSYQTRKRLMGIPEYRDAHTSLMANLRQDSRFTAREGALAVHGMWESFNAKTAAHWLGSRARVVGAAEAYANLERFLTSSSFPYTIFVAVSGVFTDHDVQFGQTLWLRHSRDVLPEALLPHGLLRSLSHLPTMAFEEKRLQPIRLHRESDGSGPFIKAPLESDDVLLCLTLVRPPATPFLVGLACQPDDWVPLEGYFNFPRSLEASGHQTRLGRDHTQLAQMIYDRVRGLSPSAKDKVRLPLRRLNTSMRRRDEADSAIDLGIALESLVLGGVETEKKYQAALRCAFFLGQDAESRRRIYHLAGEVYHLRNRAVHRGTLKESDLNNRYKGKAIREVLEDASQLVADALKQFIEAGAKEPDWDALVLGPLEGPQVT